MSLRLCMLLSLVVLGSSCSLLAPNRSFVSSMARDSDGYFVPNKHFRTVSGDSGRGDRSYEEVMKRTPASYQSRQHLLSQGALGVERRELEEAQPESLAAHYRKNQKEFNNDSEKIYFLRLKNMEEREQYLAGRRGDVLPDFTGVERSNAVRNRDILLGMSKDTVAESWGQPQRVDVAGNPRYENERWTYVKNGKLRHVYFESGRVEGWSDQDE